MYIINRFIAFPAALLTLALWLNGASARADAPATTSTATAAVSPLAKDESLSSDEYILLGMPSYDREWSATDMGKVGKILVSLVEQKGFGKLPRYQSERSGPYFARLTSPQNLSIFVDRSQPLDVRLVHNLEFMKSTAEIGGIYIYGFSKKAVRDTEVVEILGFQMRLVSTTLLLVDEFLPSLKKDDPTYPVRIEGLAKMKQGLGSLVTGSLQTVSERNSYRTSELVRLIGYMQETFPKIVVSLAPGTRTEVIVQLDQLQKDPAMQDLQPGLGELHARVNASLKNASLKSAHP